MIDPHAADLPLEARAGLPQPGLLGNGYQAQVHWTLLPAAAAMLLSLIVLARLLDPLGWYDWLLIAPLAIVVGGAAHRIFSRPWRRAAAQRIIQTTLRFDRCPGCGYTLDGLVPEPDGCITCPECGAAWRWPSQSGG